MRISRTLLLTTALASIPASSLFAEPPSAAPTELVAPTSMQQIIEWHQSLSMLGDWTTSGTTK